MSDRDVVVSFQCTNDFGEAGTTNSREHKLGRWFGKYRLL